MGRMDDEGRGFLTEEQFIECMDDPAIASNMEFIGISTNDAEMLFKLLDVNDDGEICIWELVEGLDRLKGQASSLDAHTLMRMVQTVSDQTSRLLQASGVKRETSLRT